MAKLWAVADALRNNMDAAEHKHVVPGLIFLEYRGAVGRVGGGMTVEGEAMHGATLGRDHQMGGHQS